MTIKTNAATTATNQKPATTTAKTSTAKPAQIKAAIEASGKMSAPQYKISEHSSVMSYEDAKAQLLKTTPPAKKIEINPKPSDKQVADAKAEVKARAEKMADDKKKAKADAKAEGKKAKANEAPAAASGNAKSRYSHLHPQADQIIEWVDNARESGTKEINAAITKALGKVEVYDDATEKTFQKLHEVMLGAMDIALASGGKKADAKKPDAKKPEPTEEEKPSEIKLFAKAVENAKTIEAVNKILNGRKIFLKSTGEAITFTEIRPAKIDPKQNAIGYETKSGKTGGVIPKFMARYIKFK